MTTKKKTRRPKLTREYIVSEFKRLGYTLVTKTYKGTKQPLEVRCKKGHRWVVTWNNFSRGTRCRRCFVESHTGNNKTLRKIVLRDPFYNISEAARILGVKHTELRRYIEMRLLPGPQWRVGAKMYYKMADIRKIDRLIE